MNPESNKRSIKSRAKTPAVLLVVTIVIILIYLSAPTPFRSLAWTTGLALIAVAFRTSSDIIQKPASLRELHRKLLPDGWVLIGSMILIMLAQFTDAEGQRRAAIERQVRRNQLYAKAESCKLVVANTQISSSGVIKKLEAFVAVTARAPRPSESEFNKGPHERDNYRKSLVFFLGQVKTGLVQIASDLHEFNIELSLPQQQNLDGAIDAFRKQTDDSWESLSQEACFEKANAAWQCLQAVGTAYTLHWNQALLIRITELQKLESNTLIELHEFEEAGR